MSDPSYDLRVPPDFLATKREQFEQLTSRIRRRGTDGSKAEPALWAHLARLAARIWSRVRSRSKATAHAIRILVPPFTPDPLGTREVVGGRRATDAPDVEASVRMSISDAMHIDVTHIREIGDAYDSLAEAYQHIDRVIRVATEQLALPSFEPSTSHWHLVWLGDLYPEYPSDWERSLEHQRQELLAIHRRAVEAGGFDDVPVDEFEALIHAAWRLAASQIGAGAVERPDIERILRLPMDRRIRLSLSWSGGGTAVVQLGESVLVTSKYVLGVPPGDPRGRISREMLEREAADP